MITSLGDIALAAVNATRHGGEGIGAQGVKRTFGPAHGALS